MSGEINLGGKTTTAWLLIAFIAGIVLFITMFLNWETIAASVAGTGDQIGKADISCLDLFNNKFDGNEVTYTFVAKLPLIAAILGIVGAVVAVIPTFVDKPKELSVVIGIIFLVALILCIVFFACGLNTGIFDGLESVGVSWSFTAGVGLWVALVASIVGLVGAGVSIKENFF